MTTEQYIYEFGIRANGRGFQRDGTKLERVHETDVLHLMAKEVKQCNMEKGWYDDERTFGDEIALLHSEVSEALEAFRDHGLERWVTDENGKRWIVGGEDGLQVYPDMMKPEGVGSEAADVLVRLLDFCERKGIDLFDEWRHKVNYNWTRPARHGGKRL
jgi:NTP pyrophosphatase (non-canonical NTP hydrolase)